MNVIKIILTRCQIFHLKCTKFNFGWGSAPDPAGGVHSAPPDPLARLREENEMKGRGKERGEEGEGEGEGKGRRGGEEGRGRLRTPYRGIGAPGLSDRMRRRERDREVLIAVVGRPD